MEFINFFHIFTPMSKKEIENISNRIIEAISETTNDYDAKDEIKKILKEL